jgi:hypothetical protein
MLREKVQKSSIVLSLSFWTPHNTASHPHITSHHITSHTLLLLMSETTKSDQKPSNKEKKQKKQKASFDPSKFPLPEYIEHRIKIWEEVKKANEIKNKGIVFVLF